MWLIVRNNVRMNKKYILNVFKNMQLQYSVLGYKIDLYFHEYKLAIEVDEIGHNDTNRD